MDCDSISDNGPTQDANIRKSKHREEQSKIPNIQGMITLQQIEQHIPDHLHTKHREDLDSGIDITNTTYIKAAHQQQLKTYKDKIIQDRKNVERSIKSLNIVGNTHDLRYMKYESRRLIYKLHVYRLRKHSKIHMPGHALNWFQQFLSLQLASNEAEEITTKHIVCYGKQQRAHDNNKSAEFIIELKPNTNATKLRQILTSCAEEYNKIDTKTNPMELKKMAGPKSRIIIEDKQHQHRITYTIHDVPYIFKENGDDDDENLLFIRKALNNKHSSPLPGTITRQRYGEKYANKLIVEITAAEWTLDDWRRYYECTSDINGHVFIHLAPGLSYHISAPKNQLDIAPTNSEYHGKHLNIQWNKYLKEPPTNKYFLLTRTERRIIYFQYYCKAIEPDITMRQISQQIQQINDETECKYEKEMEENTALDTQLINQQMMGRMDFDKIYHITATQGIDDGGNTISIVVDQRIQWDPNASLIYCKEVIDEIYLFIGLCLIERIAVILCEETNCKLAIINLFNEDNIPITTLQINALYIKIPTDKETTESIIQRAKELVKRFIILMDTHSTHVTSPLMKYPSIDDLVKERISKLNGRQPKILLDKLIKRPDIY